VTVNRLHVGERSARDRALVSGFTPPGDQRQPGTRARAADTIVAVTGHSCDQPSDSIILLSSGYSQARCPSSLLQSVLVSVRRDRLSSGNPQRDGSRSGASHRPLAYPKEGGYAAPFPMRALRARKVTEPNGLQVSIGGATREARQSGPVLLWRPCCFRVGTRSKSGCGRSVVSAAIGGPANMVELRGECILVLLYHRASVFSNSV
jgi:hypothetical protein